MLQACPTAAMHGHPDGIVDLDTRFCIGWRACIAELPGARPSP